MKNRIEDLNLKLEKCRSELDATVTELSDKYEELDLLYDVSETLGSLKHVYQLSDLILKKAVEHSKADNAILFSLNKERGILSVGGMYGIDWLESDNFIIRIGHGIVGKVADEGHAVIRNAIDPPLVKNKNMITALMCVPLKVNDEVIGVISVAHSSPGRVFSSVDQKLLQTLAGQAAASLDNARLYYESQKMFISIIDALAATIDAKDPYTIGHSRRVTYYATMLGAQIGGSPVFLETLKLSGLLHDVGKIGIPEAILTKSSSLSDDEYKLIMNHSLIGAKILDNIDALKHIVPVIRHHHERFGGGGYPDGLVGNDIPLAARVLAIADTFDAMTTVRPYRRGLSHEAALSEMEANNGRQFDPELMRSFRECYQNKIRRKEGAA